MSKANSNNAVVPDANTVVVPDANTIVVPDKQKHSGAHSGNSDVDFVMVDTGLSADVVPDANIDDVVMLKSSEKLQIKKEKQRKLSSYFKTQWV